jgi:hypothetical protein
MKRLRYTKTRKLSLLHDELLAAGVTPITVEEEADGAAVITVADEVQDSAVEAVVTAHNPALPSLAEQAATERTAAMQEVATQYQAALSLLTNFIDNAATMTAAERLEAQVNHARITRRLLRLVKNTLT